MSVPVEHQPQPSRVRATFWLLVSLVCIFGMQKAIVTPLDPDLFWHLRVAEQLLKEGVHPLIDRISFSSRPDPWTPYSWLPELGMKIVWDTLGYRGTILAQIAATAGIIIFIARSCLEMTRGQRLMNCAIATVLGAYLTLPYISFRPATFAIFWLALVSYLLLRDRRLEERSRAVWIVIPITILLANIHLVVIMVPIWIGCLLTGSIIERRSIKRYMILLIATALGCLATPLLPGVIRSAWHYQSADVMVKSDVIGEMHAVYAGIAGIVTCALLVVLLLLALRHRRRIRIGQWLWLIAAILFMLRLGRFTPMFAMIVAPILAEALPAMSDVVLERKLVRNVLTVVALLTFGRLAWIFPRPSLSLDAFINSDDTIAYPANAANYVEKNIAPRSHRLINEFSWGGYLGWRLGDQYQVFLDGRTQVFPADFWKATYLSGEAPIKTALEKANADAAILPLKNSRFEKALKELSWKQVYTDDRAQILIPPQ
ncbi:MAG TPA: hypothetical protein VF669_02765 [Tepidisphaeraceae bacterium]